MSDALGLQPGHIIGRDFKVVKPLASGAMGSVYIVEQLSTGKQRAMKVMSMELAGDERARERFVLEARVGANIKSEHVVEVVTAGIDDDNGVPYLVMELLEGEELADKIRREGSIGAAEAAEIIKQAGHALADAHAQGIVHRDIKPENLFVAKSRREGVAFTVKILDFGIAKLVAERSHEGTQPVGTPLFMTPEQTDRRGKIQPATDVWPLGLIAFRMLTGRDYWTCAASGISALLREIVMDPIVPASARATEYGAADKLPAGFDDWFAKCVNRDPAQRYPEAGACAAALSDLVAGAPRRPPPPPRQAGGAAPAATAQTGTAKGLEFDVAQTQGGGKSGLVLGAVGLVVVAGGIGAYLAMSAGDEQKNGETAAAAPTSSASAAPAAVAKSCPDGMVRISGGPMFMGSKDADLDDDVRPQHKVNVSPFCLDLNEVTVANYEACSGAGHCGRAANTVQFEGATAKQTQALSKLCNVGKKDKADHPINCVDWAMADNYCRTKGGRLADGGGRLPTEAEWEFAARGSSQRTYPWGDEPPGPERLNACGVECQSWLESEGLKSFGMMFDGDDKFPATAPVGSFPKGASSDKVLDLAGNVWEWTADWYGPYANAEQTDPTGPATGEERVVRGGGFNGLKPAWAKPAYRWMTKPGFFSHGIGVRCAADVNKG